MTSAHKIYRKGLSLIEVTVSSLLVGSIVVGSVSLMGASVRSYRVSGELATGPLLADALLAEIVSMSYYDPETGSGTNGTNAGELSVTRQDFDDLGDYDGWSTATVQDKQGNALPGYTGWSRAVTVRWATRIAGDEWWFYDTGLRRIIVSATSPDGVVTTRVAMRQKDGSLEQAPTLDKNVVSELEINLSLGSSGTSAQGATNLLNHAEDPNG